MKWIWIFFGGAFMFSTGWMLGRGAPTNSEQSPANEQALPSQSQVEAATLGLRDLLTQSVPTPEAVRRRDELYQQLAETDPLAFLALFQEGLAGHSQKALLLQCVETLTAADPDQAAAAIRTLPNGWQQAEAWKAFAQTGATTDPQACLTAASQSGRHQQSTMKALVDRWADEDPEAALTAVSGDGFQRNLETWFKVAGTDVMTKWLRRDPKAALDWLGKLPISKDFKGNLEYFIGHEMRSHLDDIEAMPEALRDRVISIVGKEEYLTRRHAQAILAEVSTDSDKAYASALQTMSERPFDGKQLVHDVLKKVSESSPEKALELAATLPGRNMRHDFFKDYAKRESERDPQGTFEWAKDLEDHAGRAGAVEGAIGSWIKEDFPSAIEALATVGNETWSQGFFHTITRAASADTLLGNETNQKAMATLLASMPPKKQERWIGQIMNNLGGTLPSPLRPFSSQATTIDR